jgi:hypothetical protein
LVPCGFAFSLLVGLAVIPVPPSNQEKRAVHVPLGKQAQALVMAQGSTGYLQMQNRGDIQTVTYGNELVLHIRSITSDPSILVVTGKWPEITQLTLTDQDGRKEEVAVIVIGGLFPFPHK